MISRQEILRIVADKHGLIIAPDDPILSVLAVSETIYDVYASKLSEEVKNIALQNNKSMAQRNSALQALAAEASKQLSDENRRGLSETLSQSRSDLQSALGVADSQNKALIDEFRKIRTQIIFTHAASIGIFALISLIFWNKGV